VEHEEEGVMSMLGGAFAEDIRAQFIGL